LKIFNFFVLVFILVMLFLLKKVCLRNEGGRTVGA